MKKTCKIKKVKIISSIYDVKYVEKLIGKDNESILGNISYDGQLIKINNNDKYPLRAKLKTLFHESFHAVNNEYLSQIPEKKVVVIADGLFALMLDNKEFIREILKLK